MAITEHERNEIKRTAEFLERLGYARSEDQYSINYSFHDICISIVYPPNSEESDVIIRFIEENQVFSVGWIACVRKGLNVDAHQRLENALMLISYIEENYNVIMDIDYCRNSRKLISDFIANKRNQKV